MIMNKTWAFTLFRYPINWKWLFNIL